MTKQYELQFVRDTLDDGSGQLDVWLSWLRANGFGPVDGSIEEAQVIAVAAAIRFSSADRPKAKVLRLIRQLLQEGPNSDVDWVAVDRPGTSEIAVEPGPFKLEANGSRRRAPFVFDPYSVYERLKAAR